MGFKEWITGQDQFGYAITLGYNRSDPQFKQFSGGVASIVLGIIINGYLLFLMFGLSQNSVYSVNNAESFVDFEKLGMISLEETQIVPFIRFKSLHNYQPLRIDL